MRTELEMPIPIMSQMALTGTKEIKHILNRSKTEKKWPYFYNLKPGFALVLPLLSSLKQVHLLPDVYIKAKCKEGDTTSSVCFILNYLFIFGSMIKEFLYA